MSIVNYADLQASVASWAHRSDLTAIVPDLIMLGERRIFDEVRCMEMETALNVSISSGVAALPADYLELKFAYIDGAPVSKLTRASASQIYEQFPLRTSSGKPQKVAREGSNFIFGPYPTDGYSMKGIYYAKPEVISSSANAVFLAYPDLYLMASLCELAPYLKGDQRIPVWEGKYQAIKSRIDTRTQAEEGSGGGMAVRAA